VTYGTGSEAAILAIAVAEIWQWAFFPGFDGEDAEPPAINLAALASYVRLMLSEAVTSADDAPARLRTELELTRLRLEADGYQRELIRLRELLAKADQPAPWDCSCTSHETAEPKEGKS
jgi:hypothetical protein